jgi:hypothetical protein
LGEVDVSCGGIHRSEEKGILIIAFIERLLIENRAIVRRSPVQIFPSLISLPYEGLESPTPHWSIDLSNIHGGAIDE